MKQEFKEMMLNEKYELYVDKDNSTWGIEAEKSVNKAQKNGNMLVAVAGVRKPKLIMWDFLSLNDFDKDWVKDTKIKAGEHILRLATKLGFETPLVKLNTQKGLVYFLTDKAKEEDIVEFEKKGTKLSYLRVVEGSPLSK